MFINETNRVACVVEGVIDAIHIGKERNVSTFYPTTSI